MDSIQLKTMELLTYHCGCLGNLVTMATRYVADAYSLKEPLFFTIIYPCDMAYFHQPIRIELQLCSIAQPEERETQIVLLGYDAHFCLHFILFVGLVHVVMTVAVNVFGRLLI